MLGVTREFQEEANKRNKVIKNMILFGGGDWTRILGRAKQLEPLMPLLKSIGREYIMVRAPKVFFLCFVLCVFFIVFLF
jgi:hypothetical protein